MTDLPSFSMSELLEAGVHYGHRTMRWNPKMAPYLFGSRNGTHIIDLQQTVPLLHRSLQAVYDVVRNNGRVLFVGTKRQASDTIAESAKKCGQYYVNHRWLGGMLTNWNTVSASIKTLRDIESKINGELIGYKKKEILQLTRKAEKLRKALGGIMDMGGKPDLLFVIDVNKEDISIKEAKILGIPVIAIVDSNCDPDGIDYVIPGNDDALRAITLYCQLISDAALAGIQDSLSRSGVDVGSLDKLPLEAFDKEGVNDNEGRAKKAPHKKNESKRDFKRVAEVKKAKKPAKPVNETNSKEAEKAKPQADEQASQA